MSQTLVWWLMMEVVGLATIPLCLTLFSRLPDRGYALSKAFALIIIGYLFWILNVAHILPNTSASIWVIVLALFGISTLIFLRKRDDLLGFARTRWWLILAIEVLLFLTFITAAYLRSYVSDFTGTEKPMDFMFLNAVTRANHFPPPDPWLAGEKVAYYYFGYLIVSIMTRLSSLQTSVGFNLGVAMTASLAVVGAFGLVYNMMAPRAQRELEGGPGTAAAGFTSRVLWRPMVFGLVAGLLLAVIGNLEGLFEALAAHGIGPHSFWSWANIDHQDPVVAYHSAHWYPDHFFFWWRATRMLDSGTGIHEFPFFSFLLGDLHPHVMSIPFVLLALGIAQLLLHEGPLDLVVWLERPLWLAAFAIMVGGLSFINTWDLPTMAFMVALAAFVRNRLHADSWSWGLLADTTGFLLPLFICAALAYSPFFLGGFSSQASGFKDESGSGTRPFQLLLLWGPFAMLVLPYAFWRLRTTSKTISISTIGWSFAPALFLLFLWVIWNVLGVHVDGSGKLQSGFGFDHLLGWFPKVLRPNDAVNDAGHPISLITRIGNRGGNWLTAVLLMGTVALSGLAFYREVEHAKRTGEDRFGHIFALALSTTAGLLILGSEFFFILDTFNGRMNTIFKLYLPGMADAQCRGRLRPLRDHAGLAHAVIERAQDIDGDRFERQPAAGRRDRRRYRDVCRRGAGHRARRERARKRRAAQRRDRTRCRRGRVLRRERRVAAVVAKLGQRERASSSIADNLARRMGRRGRDAAIRRVHVPNARDVQPNERVQPAAHTRRAGDHPGRPAPSNRLAEGP